MNDQGKFVMLRNGKKMKIERELSIRLLYKMMLIRAFETVVGEYKLKRQIYGMAHSYNGQEAVAAGICAALER